MRLTRGRTRLLMLSLLVVALAIIGVVNFTQVCNLEAVTINGDSVENWEADLGLSPERVIFRQPLDTAAARLLNKPGVVKVDIDYDLPDGLSIKTNSFTPVCFVLDRVSGKLKGLTPEARVVAIPSDHSDWEQPVITSVSAEKLYDYCDDPRVRVVVPQLEELRDDNVNLYRLINEIDFEPDNCVVVSIAGLPYRLKMHADDLRKQIDEFIRFVEQFKPELDSTRVLDLRFDNLVVQEERTS